MSISFSSRILAASAFLVLAAGCAGVSQLSPGRSTSGLSGAGAPLARHLAHPFANPRANEIFGERRVVVDSTGGFVKPASHGRATFDWIFASDVITGNVDAYDESTGAQVSQCAGCGGWGLAVDTTTGDLAIGTEAGSVTVWHVTASGITQYATLSLSQGASGAAAYGLAFDQKGDLYAGNWPSNAIDVFDAATIAGGGGSATRTLYSKAFGSIYFLATDGKTLLADGLDPTMNNDLLAKIDTKKGRAKILQTIVNSSGGYPGGLAVDAKHNLIVNNQYGTLSTFARPWTGAATSSFAYNWPYNSYTAISLDAAQTTVWAANLFFQTVSGNNYVFTAAQANGYPLGTLGIATSPAYQDEEYVGVALDPASKN